MMSLRVSFERSIQTCIELVQSISKQRSRILLGSASFVFLSVLVTAGTVPFEIFFDYFVAAGFSVGFDVFLTI